jgi:hypothetical protein
VPACRSTFSGPPDLQEIGRQADRFCHASGAFDAGSSIEQSMMPLPLSEASCVKLLSSCWDLLCLA